MAKIEFSVVFSFCLFDEVVYFLDFTGKFRFQSFQSLENLFIFLVFPENSEFSVFSFF